MTSLNNHPFGKSRDCGIIDSMKILLPNAKELNTNMDPQAFQTLSEQSSAILQELATKDADQLANLYKLPLERAELEYDCWSRIETGQAKSYPAWLLYDGLMYRYMKRKKLSEKEEKYLQERVLLATGFYGLISPFTLISPHRLDFQGSLKVAGKSLKQFWRPYFDAAVEQEDLIISLASSEFEQVFSPTIQKRLVRLVFMEEKNGQRKTHSTISKKGRGRFLSWMAETNCSSLDQLKEAVVDGFAFDPALSTDQQLYFVRKGENSD